MPVKNVVDRSKCSVCWLEYKNGDQISGIRLGHVEEPGVDHREWAQPGKYVEGHYECVLKSLTPEEQLQLLHKGVLPPQQVIDKQREAIRRRLNETPETRAQEIAEAPKA